MTLSSRAYWCITLTLAAVAALFVVVLFGPMYRVPAIDRPMTDENVLRIAYLQDLQPDPHRRTLPMPAHNQFILALWEPLIECDPETGQPQPAAAESWSWSADRLTLTLRLRPDGRWSNGDAVTAHDFVRAWRQLLRRDTATASALFALKQAEQFHRGKLTDPEAVGVEAVDDLTLKLSLGAVRSTLVTELAEPLLAPLHVSMEQARAARSYLRNPASLVTNGPFALEYAAAGRYRLRASPHFRERRHVKLGGVEFLRADGPRLAQLLVAAGIADIASPLSGVGPVQLPTDRCVTEESEMALSVMALDLNVRRGPLQDVRVRRALALALDRESSIPPDARETLVPAYGWVPDMPGRPGLKVMRENADEARALLAQAGYPEGKNFPVLVLPIPADRRLPHLEAWTERWFRELGIRTYQAYQPRSPHLRAMSDGDYDIFYTGLVATVPDAGDMLGTFAMPGMFSRSHWEKPEIADWMREADRRSGAERLELLEKIEREALAAVPTIPMTFTRRRTLVAAEVEGWYADPLGRQSLKRLSLRRPVHEPEFPL